MQNKPLVSAIVSTYNSEKFIKWKIEDLLSQTMADRLEIVIVNSGSKQNEDEIIKQYLYGNEDIVYIRTEERETIYAAWNRGIKASHGKYITNSNTDDRLRKDAFEILSNYLESNGNVALVYADQYATSIPNESFDKKKISNKILIPEYDRLKMLDQAIILSQPMWRAKLHFEDDIWFNEDSEICGDHEFELHIAEKYPSYHINEVLGNFYYAPDKSNKSFENFDKVISERLELTNKYIRNYVDSLTQSEAVPIADNFKRYINTPIPAFYLVKNIIKYINPASYRNDYFFTIEFAYFISALLFVKIENLNKAKKTLKKYLKYRNSERIVNLLEELNGQK